jgi:valyl-tRNA synthetase
MPDAEPTPEELERKKAEKKAAKAEAARLKEDKFKAKQAKAEAEKAAKAAKDAAGSGGASPSKKTKEVKKEAAVEADPGADARNFVNPTAKGELKSMAEPMEPAYKPHAVEASWNDWWEASGHYRGESSADDRRPKFSIVLPPPNVTGSLHLGHALTVAVQDMFCRWHRMRGFNVLWIPGTDHAGIATQVVVEKKLMKERGQSRRDLGREAFVKEVHCWKEAYGANICRQLRRLGCSLDWEREVFTMDGERAAAVSEAFVRFHEAGLVYRDVRLTNWCCKLCSGISDIEVDKIDIDGRTMLPVPGHDKDKKYEFGMLWSFAYKVDDGSGDEIVVATTRPETMLGDTAVAVHPADARYKKHHGKTLVHPFVDRKVKLITDGHEDKGKPFIDMNFGTGAVKITPAHDPNDFACGRRNGLAEVTVLTDDGKMAPNCGQFAGMMRFDARVAVLKALKEKGLHRGEAENKMVLPKCSRTGDIIEPMLKRQWWVDCSGMARRAMEVVKSGELRITPAEYKATWFDWLEKTVTTPWCVSRQLWWGHRIPVYYAAVRGEPMVDREGVPEALVAPSAEAAASMAAAKYACAPADVSLTQDEDVLDTWFSSGLFPFSCVGWPDEQSEEYRAWHPTTLLETGSDILFFWVARMVMCSLQLTDKLPFTEVFLHAMVRDKHGRKMSKSLGNVIDPLEVIDGVSLNNLLAKLDAGNLVERELVRAKEMNSAEYPAGIAACGSDALRFGLLAHTGQGRDINLDVARVVGYSKFCNKLWNATRFAFKYLGEGGAAFRPGRLPAQLAVLADRGAGPRVDLPSLPDAWILSRLADTVAAVDGALREYRVAAAADAIYVFWYSHLCDVYLEAIKPTMQLDSSSVGNAAVKHMTQTVLHACLHYGLRLLHPFMPFVTEELFQRLALLCGEPRATIMAAPFPEPAATGAFRNAPADAAMEVVGALAASVRSLRANYLKGGLTKHAPAIYIVTRAAATAAIVAEHGVTLKALAKTSQSPPPASVELVPAGCSPPRGCVTEVVDAATEVHILLKGVVDFSKESARQHKEAAAVQARLDKLQKKMGASDYAAKCPAATQAPPHLPSALRPPAAAR